jgi:hypothetical protein
MIGIWKTIYLYWYLAFGCIVLVIILVPHLVSKWNDRNSLVSILKSTRSKQEKFTEFLINALVGIFVVAFSPVAIVFLLMRLLPKKEPIISEEPKGFMVLSSDLVEELTIDEIERRAIVVDPLGAVPNLPFGHLNAPWKRFKESFQENDKIWSFSALRTSSWGQKDLKLGYAISRGEDIAGYFLTERNKIDE